MRITSLAAPNTQALDNLKRGFCRAYILHVKKPPKPVREFHVGDRVKVNPHRGSTFDAVVKAVTTDQKGRVRLQIQFGKDKTALIYDWQVCD